MKFLSVMQRHGARLSSFYVSFIFCGGGGLGSLSCIELGVITAMDAVAPPPLSRFNAPKYEVSVQPNSAFPCNDGSGFTKETTYVFIVLES